MTTITLPLDQFLQYITSHGETYVPKLFGDIIVGLTKNSPECGYYVETVDRDGNKMPFPKVWQYTTWKQSNDLLEKQRKYSQQQRDERFVFEANVKLVQRAVRQTLLLSNDHAAILAYKLVKERKLPMIEHVLGVEKLYENVNEI